MYALSLKKIFVNTALLLAGLFFGLIIVENLAGYYLKKSTLGRKIAYIDDKSVSPFRYRFSYKQSDRELGCSLKAGTEDTFISSEFTVIYSINSHGRRDKEIPLEKPKGEFRILALGESTVFGEGVNYGKRLTEIIEQALGNVEVINMGVPGFGLDQSFLYLKRNGFQFNPDVVVIFIFFPDYLDRCMDITGPGSTTVKPRFILSKDRNGLMLQDTEHIRKEFESEISPQESNTVRTSEAADGKSKIQNHKIRISYSNALTLINYYAKKQKIDKAIRSADTKFLNNVFEIISWQYKRRERYKREDFKRLIFLLIVEYQKICSEHNVDLAFINMSTARLGSVERACKALKIPYLDLSKIITRASQSEKLDFPINRHFNDIYHRIVGEYVSDYLRKRYNLKGNSNYLYKYLGKFGSGENYE